MAFWPVERSSSFCQTASSPRGLGALVDAAKAMRLVDDHEVPVHLAHEIALAENELVRADNDLVVDSEGVLDALLREGVRGARFQDDRRQEELVLELDLPLLPQRGGNDKQDAAAALGPLLREDERGLDRLVKADLVGQ